MCQREEFVKRHHYFLAFAVLACNHTVFAGTFDATNRPTVTTINGVTYERCKLKRVQPDGITIMHSKGIAKIPFIALSKEIQAEFKYDPSTSAKFQVDSAAAKSKYRKRLKQSEARKNAEQDHMAAEEAIAAAAKHLRKRGLRLDGDVAQVLDDGILLKNATTVGLYTETVEQKGFIPLGSKWAKVTREAHYRAAPEYKNVFIIGDARGLIDGERWRGIVYPAGTYSYTTVVGAGATVKCFAVTPETALEKLLNESR
jgi:hypothetical protein